MTFLIVEDVYSAEHFLHVGRPHESMIVFHRHTPPTFRPLWFLFEIYTLWCKLW